MKRTLTQRQELIFPIGFYYYSPVLKPTISIWGSSVVSSIPCGPEYQLLKADTDRPYPLTSDPSSDVDTAWNHLSSSLDLDLDGFTIYVGISTTIWIFVTEFFLKHILC